ncbi:uncharacterized protein ACRADG_013306 [Cochliomyia hominivorax]
MDNVLNSFNFGAVDYILFALMLSVSAGVGIYFGFISKLKNTTNEYLMGSKQMRPIPIAISLIASQLSGIVIMSVPAEIYSFGFTYIFYVLSIILMIPILNYIIIPVYYNNNVSTCYEYLEVRFNKGTRQLATAAFVLNSFLTLPIYMFVPSLAFSQVSGINVHLINSVVSSICVFYTMLGGIKAVVWTDVLQAGVMMFSVVLVGILGTIKVGGLGRVLDNANEGGRLNMNTSIDLRVRSTVWNLFIGGLLVWVGHIGMNQTSVQRIVALPTVKQAKKALTIVGVGTVLFMGFNCFIGLVMFARYFGCNPILGGIVAKADKLMPFFVQDVMGHILGMPGIFMSCVFSAALSTLSAKLNSLAGVVYFDYIKPFIRHSDQRANYIMKIFIFIMGIYCVLGGIIVQRFKSIIQTINTIQGITSGAKAGLFLMGMFVPRVNGKVAYISIATSVSVMIWIIINAQIRIEAGYIKYKPLPTSLDRCEAFSFHNMIKNRINSSSIFTTTEKPLVTGAFESNRDFSLYEISFYWFKLMGAAIIFISGIPLSYIWKSDKEDKMNYKLYSPFIKRFLKKSTNRTNEEIPLITLKRWSIQNAFKDIYCLLKITGNVKYKILFNSKYIYILKMASVIDSTLATAKENLPKNFTFGTMDYIVFVLMLCISAGIGVYFGFFSKSKNTTDEYLMGSKKMKTIPIAISLVASQLSGIAIMSVPAENYAFGFSYILLVFPIILVIPILNYIIVPVFYNNNISNCYEYLEMRFNKGTRQLVTASFVLNACLMLPVFIFVPSLAFSQVTGINIHLINGVVCSICIFYTMLGGIKAVVWTDVVQAGIMITSVVLVGVLGAIKVGGLSKVLEYAGEGGRLDFSYSLDPRVRSTFWNMFAGGLLMWTGHIGLNQSCVQRIVSLPSLKNARHALIIACIGVLIIMGFNSFIGIVMFARYYGCDPILGGVVEKFDKMMPFFVQDLMGHWYGMPGIFISCVFSAALSTMSAMLNSMAGVVYFDYIKPFVKHTDAKANNIMKIFVVVMGCYCILGGLMVQRFTSILQTIITITGINTGAVVGVFLLGMFVPRVSGKVAVISIGFSVGAMLWIIVNAQMRFKAGYIKYDALPTNLERCESLNFQGILKNVSSTSASFVSTETPLVTGTLSSNRDFSIYEISFYWYKVLGAFFVWLAALPLSYIWKRDKEEKMDPKLYSPFVKRFLSQPVVQTKEMIPLKTPPPSIADESPEGVIISETGNGNEKINLNTS